MEQKGLFDEEGKFGEESQGDEIEGLREKVNIPKKRNTKLILGIGLLLIAGAYAANTFLLKEEEPVPPPPIVKIPIKGAPVMANVTGAKAAPVAGKEVVEVKGKPKAEAKVAKKEEAKVKVGAKAEKKVKEAVKAAPKEAVKAEAKVAKKEEVKAKAEVKAEKETPKEVKGERVSVIVGVYAAQYELDAAQEKLKRAGIRGVSRAAKKKLVMNRVFVQVAMKKEDVQGLLSDLKEKGYEPFSVLSNGGYKVYAVSNLSEDIANENKADLEKLGYSPVIEKTPVNAKVYELIAGAKGAKEAKALSARLKKLGFKPEVSR